MIAIFKKFSAWFPMAMSIIALLMVFGYASLNGIQQHADEGTAARMFQLLLVGQVPIIGYFIVKWFPKHQKEVVRIVVIQILAALLPFFIVMLLEM